MRGFDRPGISKFFVLLVKGGRPGGRRAGRWRLEGLTVQEAVLQVPDIEASGSELGVGEGPSP